MLKFRFANPVSSLKPWSVKVCRLHLLGKTVISLIRAASRARRDSVPPSGSADIRCRENAVHPAQAVCMRDQNTGTERFLLAQPQTASRVSKWKNYFNKLSMSYFQVVLT